MPRTGRMEAHFLPFGFGPGQFFGRFLAVLIVAFLND